MSEQAVERIAAALERAWDVQCSGHRNPGVCESCRAYENAVAIVQAEAEFPSRNGQ